MKVKNSDFTRKYFIVNQDVFTLQDGRVQLSNLIFFTNLITILRVCNSP